MSFAPHVWDDGTHGLHGEGISRPAAGAKTKRFTVLVRMEKSAPVRVSTFAEDADAARRYMQSRWPNAAVEVLV